MKIFLVILLFLIYSLYFWSSYSPKTLTIMETLRKRLVSKYEKMAIKDLVVLQDLLLKKLVAFYTQPIDSEELTKLQMSSYYLSEILEQKRERFEFED